MNALIGGVIKIGGIIVGILTVPIVVKVSADILVIVAVLGAAAAAVFQGGERIGTVVTSGAAASREGSRVVDDFDRPAGDETMDRGQACGDELATALSAGAELVGSVRDAVHPIASVSPSWSDWVLDWVTDLVTVRDAVTQASTATSSTSTICNGCAISPRPPDAHHVAGVNHVHGHRSLAAPDPNRNSA